MPSDLIVSVATIEELQIHPNADRLEIAIVLGWQCLVPKGRHTAGETVVFFPPATLLPDQLAADLGVSNYVSNKKRYPGFGMVSTTKLRGEPSLGLVVSPPENVDWAIGDNVADYYGAVKYEPPPQMSTGNNSTQHPLFPTYTSINNLRNFPHILEEGESVIITEKIHGTNSRVGIIEDDSELIEVAGSHHCRKASVKIYADSFYWRPWEEPGVADLLNGSSKIHKQSVLFGEMYGTKIQGGFFYDADMGTIGYRAFDLLLDGKFVDHADLMTVCESFGVSTVPILYEGPFNMAVVKELSVGKSAVPSTAHVREGVVVKPVVERTHPKIGRVILKYISDSFLVSRHPDVVMQ